MHNNKVELVDWSGGDRAAARAAWTSTQIDVNKKSEEQIRELIVNKLWNNGTGKAHKTPFERATVEFNITCCQPSHIHLLKHRLANINGESARYKELKEDKYYLPEDWKDINVKESIEAGGWNHAIGEDIHTSPDKWFDVLRNYTEIGNKLYHQALKDLTPILGRKRAKESARYFKTMNSQITLSVTMNMSCFHNFYNLRADDAAQKEIQWIAEDMFNLVKNIPEFKYIIEAFELEKEKKKEKKYSIQEIAEHWEKLYGESFREQYEGFYEKLSNE